MYHKNIFGKSMYSLHYWLSQRKLNRNEIKIQSATANQFAVVVLLIRQTNRATTYKFKEATKHSIKNWNIHTQCTNITISHLW